MRKKMRNFASSDDIGRAVEKGKEDQRGEEKKKGRGKRV